MIRNITTLTVFLLFCTCGTSQVNFENLTRFERKINFLEITGDYYVCNSTIDKHLEKGKLSNKELNFAYYTKCRLYGQITFDFWGVNDNYYHNQRNRIQDVYPYSEVFPINQADTLIRYSSLFFKTADTTSLVYKAWYGFVYNEIYRIIDSGLDTLCKNALRGNDYYQNHKMACDGYFIRINFLRHAIRKYHPANQFGIDLMEFRLKFCLGLLNETDELKLIQLISDYMHDRFDLQKFHAFVYWGNGPKDYSELYGMGEYGDMRSMMTDLYNHDLELARRILKVCPDDITYSFAGSNQYDTTWQISESAVLKQTRLIDLRDSITYETNVFPLYTPVEIKYNVPVGDTIIINKIICDEPEVHSIELTECMILSGKGTQIIQVITYFRIPEINQLSKHNINHIRLISNRGEREFMFQVNIIGQAKTETEAMKEQINKRFVQRENPYHYEEVLEIICDEKYGTDTLKIYQYPDNTIPIYKIVPNKQYEEPKRIHPLEITNDTLYHFNLLEETSDAYKVIYSNYFLDYEIAWIKKKDLTANNANLIDVVKLINLTQFFKDCEYIVLRNPMQEIYDPNDQIYHFSSDTIMTECKRFKYVSHRDEPGEFPTMVVVPCENCTHPKLLEWRTAQLEWADTRYMLIECINTH